LCFSIHCAQCFLSIVFYSDNSNGQESQESPGMSFDASYKLQRKLHHNDNPGEVTLLNNVMNNCKPIKSGTEPVLKLKDDFWVGDGADVECNFHGIAKQGTNPAEFFGNMTVQVSSKSAARKRRCEARLSCTLRFPVHVTLNSNFRRKSEFPSEFFGIPFFGISGPPLEAPETEGPNSKRFGKNIPFLHILRIITILL